jgi:hypothetical protein
VTTFRLGAPRSLRRREDGQGRSPAGDSVQTSLRDSDNGSHKSDPDELRLQHWQ